MQSCPYEISILRKYYFKKSAATNNIKEYFEFIKELLVLPYDIGNKFVYHYIGVKAEVIVLSVWCSYKYVILISECLFQVQLPVFVNLKLRNYHCGDVVKNFIVSILLLLWWVEKVQKYKLRPVLNSHKFIILEFIFAQIRLAIHNVICCFLLSYWIVLQFFNNINLYYVNYLHEIKESKLSFLYPNCLLNGSCINSVMEVDESSKEINENVMQVIKEEKLDLNVDSERSENEYLTVIKNEQTMKEPDCPQINNSIKYINFKDNNEFKEAISEKVEAVANGELVSCLSKNENSDKLLNSVIDKIDKIDSKFVDSNLENEEICRISELNGTDVFNTCKSEDFSPKSIVDKKSNKNEEDVKDFELVLTDSSAEKDKTKSNDHSGNISLTNSSSSSSISASKKLDEHSWSHHSSSSASYSKSKYKEYKGYSHHSSSSNKSCHERSSSHRLSDQDRSKYESSDKKKSRSCHHKSDEKCHCKSHHHSRHHSKKSKKFQSVKTQCTADEIAYELRSNKTEISNPYFTRVPWIPHPQLTNLKYGRYFRIEIDRNGGASTVHLYMDEINHLSDAQMKECAIEFIKLSYSEDESECAYHVMGIVHGAAAYLPDLVDYMADHYPTLTVKTGSLASRDNHTTTMSQYRDEVYKTYSNGTFRYAPLDQLSICGVLGEEVGAYFPDFVARLEQSPFMKPVMPWSSLSVVETDNPRESNDGPIFWVRPGEQMLPANEALKESARPKKRRNNELDNLAYIAGSRSSEARESLFMDRTKAHADQVGVDYGLSNTAPTAAVGVLKSVNCGHPEHGNRATKDVIAFHAQDYNELLEILMLDLYEPPQTQCTKWIEISKLNTLRREGIRYAHVQLHDNDVYYLPRKIIHQFQTISSVASVAWHIRYKDYFSIMGAPNLHTPTGINKGQVFYEKKNVAVYYPPVCENELLASVTNPSPPLIKTPKKSDKIKDYSPYKHSPRKNHKIHSPRTSSKKEKGSESVPQSSSKKELECVSNSDDKKLCSIKKQEYLKSENGREIYSSECSKKEGSSSRKNEKSESSAHYQLSEHSSPKKERRENHESSSNHRKEVKNLEADFDLKKNKSKSTKSPSKTKIEKSGHDDRRKSDEIKYDSSSKHKKHDESRSKSHNKYDKNLSHKKSNLNSTLSNGALAENSGKSEAKTDKNISLKRKNSESQNSHCSKRVKENPVAVITEGAGFRESSNFNDDKIINEFETNSVNSEFIACHTPDKKEIKSNFENSDGNENLVCDNTPESTNSETTDKIPTQVKSELNENNFESNIVNREEIETTDILNMKSDAEFADLKPNVSCSRGNFSSVTPYVSPPLPSSSPPSNPPLPPNSPVLDLSTIPCAASENNDLKAEDAVSSEPMMTVCNVEESTSLNSTARDQEHSFISKDKSNDLLQGKKLKKKIVKKIIKEGNESYDLLGDIMSQMDKKK